MTGTAMAQQAKVTSLMSKDLTENPGKEVLKITVEYPLGDGGHFRWRRCAEARLREDEIDFTAKARA